jgi:hypothetical protein
MSVPGVGLHVRQKKAPVYAGAEGSTGEVQVLQPTPVEATLRLGGLFRGWPWYAVRVRDVRLGRLGLHLGGRFRGRVWVSLDPLWGQVME